MQDNVPTANPKGSAYEDADKDKDKYTNKDQPVCCDIDESVFTLRSI